MSVGSAAFLAATCQAAAASDRPLLPPERHVTLSARTGPPLLGVTRLPSFGYRQLSAHVSLANVTTTRLNPLSEDKSMIEGGSSNYSPHLETKRRWLASRAVGIATFATASYHFREACKPKFLLCEYTSSLSI